MLILLDFLNQNSGAIQAATTVILVAITAYYTWQTRRTVQIMQQSERNRNRPHIFILFEPRSDRYNLVDLVIINKGLGLAKDISFSISKDLMLIHEGEMLSKVPAIRDGLKSLAPDQIIRIPLVALANDSGKMTGAAVAIDVKYDAENHEQYQEQFTLDFNTVLMEHTLGKPPLYRIADSLEKMSAVSGKKR